MSTWVEDLFAFYTSMKPLPQLLPHAVQWLHPQKDEAVLKVVYEFLLKYFNDRHKRTLLLGINPGRFGAGVTGVNFTAPKQLTQNLNITHPFKNQTEMSAEFIYAVIEAFGGATVFYRHFFIGSVCPLGFVQNGKNINYYDDKDLQKTVEPFIVQQLTKLVSFPVNRNFCLCIGGEKNYRYLSSLNEKHGWFEHIESLPHPRFIMQYKRKSIQQYVQLYLELLTKAMESNSHI